MGQALMMMMMTPCRGKGQATIFYSFMNSQTIQTYPIAKTIIQLDIHELLPYWHFAIKVRASRYIGESLKIPLLQAIQIDHGPANRITIQRTDPHPWNGSSFKASTRTAELLERHHAIPNLSMNFFLPTQHVWNGLCHHPSPPQADCSIYLLHNH